MKIFSQNQFELQISRGKLRDAPSDESKLFWGIFFLGL